MASVLLLTDRTLRCWRSLNVTNIFVPFQICKFDFSAGQNHESPAGGIYLSLSDKLIALLLSGGLDWTSDGCWRRLAVEATAESFTGDSGSASCDFNRSYRPLVAGLQCWAETMESYRLFNKVNIGFFHQLHVLIILTLESKPLLSLSFVWNNYPPQRCQ